MPRTVRSDSARYWASVLGVKNARRSSSVIRTPPPLTPSPPSARGRRTRRDPRVRRAARRCDASDGTAAHLRSRLAASPLPYRSRPGSPERHVDIHQPPSRQSSAPRPPLLLGLLSIAATPIATPRGSETEFSVSETEIIYLETGPPRKVTPQGAPQPSGVTGGDGQASAAFFAAGQARSPEPKHEDPRRAVFPRARPSLPAATSPPLPNGTDL